MLILSEVYAPFIIVRMKKLQMIPICVAMKIYTTRFNLFPGKNFNLILSPIKNQNSTDYCNYIILDDLIDYHT